MPSSTSKTAKKKKAKKPTKAQLGRRSRVKGGAFERKIAAELRVIYDPPELVAELVAALEAKDLKEYKRLLKASNVSRGEQTRGAKHADLLIDECPFWLELQDAGPQKYNPRSKLEQAERDVRESESDKWPAAVCHRLGRRSIQVCMRYDALAWIATGYCFADADAAENIVVMIDWEDFKGLLQEHEDERRQ